jgi:hypothetical protein
MPENLNPWREPPTALIVIILEIAVQEGEENMADEQ